MQKKFMLAVKLFFNSQINKSIASSVRKMAAANGSALKKPKIAENTIATHSGTFHCDELLAVFLLQKHPSFKDHVVLRTRDQSLIDQCDIVVDVGSVFDPLKKRFDHHQASFNETITSLRPELEDKDNIRLSSAGLIYIHYGEKIIDEILRNEFKTELTEAQLMAVFKKIYSGFIKEIDAIDNGVPQGELRYRINSHLSSRVKNFNPDWMDEKTPEEIDQLFEKAKVYVGAEFIDKVKYFTLSWLPARKIVEMAVKKRFDVHKSGKIIELERFCPWQEHLRDIEDEVDGVQIQFVIFNGGSKGVDDFRVQAVPVEAGSFVCRKFLAKKWCGLRDNELEEASGVEGAKFVHATGFIGGNKSQNGALEMAVKSLED